MALHSRLVLNFKLQLDNKCSFGDKGVTRGLQFRGKQLLLNKTGFEKRVEGVDTGQLSVNYHDGCTIGFNCATQGILTFRGKVVRKPSRLLLHRFGLFRSLTILHLDTLLFTQSNRRGLNGIVTLMHDIWKWEWNNLLPTRACRGQA